MPTTDQTVEVPADWTALVVHKQAVETIRDMQRQVQVLGAVFGPRDPRYIDTAVSLAREVPQLLAGDFGTPQRVSKDGDLSLFVSTNGFVYGVIFHGSVSRDAITEHPKAVDNSAGCLRTHIHCMTCDEPVLRKDGDVHDDHRLMRVPTWGTWSFHS